MPTNNKTPHLQLNSWVGTDKPMRTDFVSDNTILDTTIYNHTSDTDLHFTTAEKAWINAPISIGLYGGTGSNQELTFSFQPKVVIVFYKLKPVNYYDAQNEYNVHNFAVATQSNVGSGGASLRGTTLTLTQTQSTPTDGNFYNLSKLNGQYCYIAFK